MKTRFDSFSLVVCCSDWEIPLTIAFNRNLFLTFHLCINFLTESIEPFQSDFNSLFFQQIDIIAKKIAYAQFIQWNSQQIKTWSKWVRYHCMHTTCIIGQNDWTHIKIFYLINCKTSEYFVTGVNIPIFFHSVKFNAICQVSKSAILEKVKYRDRTIFTLKTQNREN